MTLPKEVPQGHGAGGAFLSFQLFHTSPASAVASRAAFGSQGFGRVGGAIVGSCWALGGSGGAQELAGGGPHGVAPVREYATRPGKKRKLKPYSAFKRRFKLLATGEYKRWRAGKRHNASSKTPKQRRQLRQPTVVAPGHTRALRALNFVGL